MNTNLTTTTTEVPETTYVPGSEWENFCAEWERLEAEKREAEAKLTDSQWAEMMKGTFGF